MTGKHTVYKHTSPSGKVYIGITCQKPERRWGRDGEGYKHSPHFMAAIKRHGWENIRHEIVAEGLSQEQAEQLEIELIMKYKATDKAHGYNIDRGGSTGPKHTEETRTRIGNANRGRTQSTATREKLRAYKLTHPTSAATAKKIGDANRGRRHRPESIEKIRAAQNSRAVRNLTTGATYSSVMDAARASGVEASKIVKVCKGKRKSAGGFAWAYKEVVI